METNVIEKYDLIDGIAIIDQNFIIITANEIFYRFVGLATNYTITDIIHQVDLDDFIDVANSLRPNTCKSMVLRMKRVDNSFRWMLLKVRKRSITDNNKILQEYLELNISDIMTMDKQNESYRETLINYSHLLALQGEVVFCYNRETHIINLYNFIDNSLISILEQHIQDFEHNYVNNGFISTDTIEEFRAFCKNIQNNNSSFTNEIAASFLNMENRMELLELKGSVTCQKDIVVGSIRNIDMQRVSYTHKTYDYSSTNGLLSFQELYDYVSKNIEYNTDCEFAVILFQLDDFKKMQTLKEGTFTDKLMCSIIQAAKDIVAYRGVVSSYDEDTICIAVKDINTDIKTRAFIEALRSKITWNYKRLESNKNIAFSIGISRYPNNDRNADVIFMKARRALKIAKFKGGKRYIIYREHLHDEILLTNQ